VDWFCPPFSCNVIFNLLSSLVNAQTNDLDLITPFLTIFFKHLLIMGHWGLAWWTPCSPEINHQNFTLIVLNLNWGLIVIKCSNIFNDLILVSSTNNCVNTYAYSFNTINDRLDFFIEFSSFFSLRGWKTFSNFHNCFCFNFVSGQCSN